VTRYQTLLEGIEQDALDGMASSAAAATGNVTPDYWVTVATVIPVLALALVIEIRAVSQLWTEETPTWLMFIQATASAAPLVSFAILLPLALQGVRGQEMPSWLPTFSEYLVALSVGILFLSPAMGVLVRANARQVAALLTLAPGLRLRAWKAERRVTRLQDSVRKMEWEHEQAAIYRRERYASMQKRVATAGVELDALKKKASAVDSEEVRQHLTLAQSLYDGLTRDVENARQETLAEDDQLARNLNEFVREVTEARTQAAEDAKAVRENRAAWKAAMTRHLLQPNVPNRSGP